MILWPRDQLPVEELEHTLLRTVMRCAGVIPNIWNRSAVASALHWTTLQDPERKKPTSRSRKQTDLSQLSINEMHRRTLTIALRIARTNDAKKYRSTILAALRFFHRRKTKRRVGHPEADRSRLGIVTAVLRRPREKNVRAIANRIVAYGDPALDLRRLEDFVADFIGTRRKKRKKRRPIKLTDRQKLREKRKKRLKSRSTKLLSRMSRLCSIGELDSHGRGPMWKPEHRRAAAERGCLRYPSDMGDVEWALVAPMIPPARRGGRPRDVNVREVLNAVFYVLATGCQWQALPMDLPPKSTAHHYFILWDRDGTLVRIHDALYVAVCEAAGREASPSAAIIDSKPS